MSTVALVAAPLLAVIALEDLRHHRIRNQYVLALAAAAVCLVAVAVVGGDSAAAGRAALGALLGSAPLATVWVTQPGRIGGGDVKLAATLGALVGTAHPLLAVAAVGLGLVGSLGVTLATRRQTMPLGPGLAAGAVVAIVVSAAT